MPDDLHDKVADWMHDLVVPNSKRYHPKQVKPVETKPMAMPQRASQSPSVGAYKGTETGKQLEELNKQAR